MSSLRKISVKEIGGSRVCLSVAVTLKPQIRDKCELLGLPPWCFPTWWWKQMGKVSLEVSLHPCACFSLTTCTAASLSALCVLSEERKMWGITPFPGEEPGSGYQANLPCLLFADYGSGMLQRWDSSGGKFYVWLLEWHTFSAKTGTHYAMGKVFSLDDSKTWACYSEKAHPHSTQTMRARPGVGPRFSMNRTERRASDPLPICKGILEAIAQKRKCHTCP